MNFVDNSVHVFQAGAETTCQFPQNCLASVLRRETACIAHKRSYTSEIVFHLQPTMRDTFVSLLQNNLQVRRTQ
jgi:hypothetical protein